MRELTREEKLRIAAEADRIQGVTTFSDERQLRAFDDAMSNSPMFDIDWCNVVRRLAASPMPDTTDKLTPSEREIVEEYRTGCNDLLVAIIDRLAPKVAP